MTLCRYVALKDARKILKYKKLNIVNYKKKRQSDIAT